MILITLIFEAIFVSFSKFILILDFYLPLKQDMIIFFGEFFDTKHEGILNAITLLWKIFFGFLSSSIIYVIFFITV